MTGFLNSFTLQRAVWPKFLIVMIKMPQQLKA